MDGVDAQVHEPVIVDAEHSCPVVLVLPSTSFGNSLLGMKEIGVGCLLWMRGQILRTVLSVERLLGGIGH